VSDFHFLRPWWLVALLPVAMLVWQHWKATDPSQLWSRVIAPHLLSHLLISQNRRAGHLPLLWAPILGGLAVIALAGPTWHREPAPFAEDTANLIVVLKVTRSMTNVDIQPSRLGRAIQKIRDLLDKRPGAATALIAYSGTAHRVVPLTTDTEILTSFATELDPNVMPDEGDCAADALRMANAFLAKSGNRGWILWVCDATSSDQYAPIKKVFDNGLAPISVLAVAGEGRELMSVRKAAGIVNADVVSLTPDTHDIEHLAANTRFSNADDGTAERWQDAGYWLVPFLSLMHQGWFRRGWVIQPGGTA